MPLVGDTSIDHLGMGRHYADFLEHLLSHESFLVVTHVRPDADAIGSQLAVGRFLQKLGKHSILGGTGDIPSNIAWLDRSKMIEPFTGDPLQLVRFGELDAVVVVDANGVGRLGSLSDMVEHHRGEIFVIDHHPDPDSGFDAYAVDTTASATAEIIYRLIASDYPELIDEEMALHLYTAIMTDTGSFRYGNVTPDVLEIVADLFRRGSFSAEEVYNRVYKTRSQAGQLLLGEALQTLSVTAHGRLGHMKVTRRMFDRTGATSEDVEAFTDHILAVEGIEMALLFMEVGDHVKISFRSQGDLPVNTLAERFGGGGHRNASGAFVRGQIDSVIENVVREASATIPAFAQ